MNKRVFFGFNIITKWPKVLPKGRLLQEHERHMTVAFLGNIDYSLLEKVLMDIPKPTSPIGFSGTFNKIKFLPEKHPNVVAWHGDLGQDLEWVQDYSKVLVDWLISRGFDVRRHEEFLPHVTVARKPFMYGEWRQQFTKRIFVTSALNLYESVGGLRYVPIWSHALLPAFEQMGENNFLVRGAVEDKLVQHAAHALAYYDGSIHLKSRTLAEMIEEVKTINPGIDMKKISDDEIQITF